MSGEVAYGRLQRLGKKLRRVVFVVVGGVLLLTVLAMAIGIWRGERARAGLLNEDGVHVVPHVLRNTYTGDARFEAICVTPGTCQAEADRICGGALVVLEQRQDADGLWTLLAECDAGRAPEW